MLRGHNRARATTFLGLVVTLYLVTGTADWPQPLNVKTGLWEVTTTVTTSEEIPIPDGLLEKLTPEQRARAEERVKARKAGPQKTSIAKLCLASQELERGMPFRPARKSCTWTVVTSTSSKVEARGVCVSQGTKTEGTLRIEALSPEEAEGSIQLLKKNDNTSVTISTFKAKWIGSFCRTL
jgi:hypothetical protein